MKYNISIGAIFQNEADFLKEWIEYHRLIGVEHFWLYNNSSNDNYIEVLNPYINSGVVELIDWPNMEDVSWHSRQKQAYCNCITRSSGVTKWLAVIDVDEFIVPKNSDSLNEFLKPYEWGRIGGIVIHWQMFGTSDFWEIPEGNLMIECLNKKAEKDIQFNKNQKSIVRPDRCSGYAIHHAIY